MKNLAMLACAPLRAREGKSSISLGQSLKEIQINQLAPWPKNWLCKAAVSSWGAFSRQLSLQNRNVLGRIRTCAS